MRANSIEEQLRDELQKTDNAPAFRAALEKFLLKVPELTPIEFEKVFAQMHRPNTKKHLIKTVVDIQHEGSLKPNRDISFNSDASRFQILDLTINDSVIHMRSQYPLI